MNRQKTTTQAHHETYGTPTLGGGILQRKCGCGTHSTGGNQCASCQKEKTTGRMQRVATSANHIDEAPPIVNEVLSSPGQSLDQATRGFMESRFHHDFSSVRVHVDRKAAESAGAVNALAYTVGRNVVFGPGQYAPGTSEGQRTLAHELMHVVQQQGSSTGGTGRLSVGSANDPSEQQAQQAENIITAGPRAGAVGGPWSSGQITANAGNTLYRRVNPRFVSCNPPTAAIEATTGADPAGTIAAANARAIEMLTNVIDELQFTRNNILAGAEASSPTVSDGLAQIITNRFHLDPSDRNIWTRRGEGTVDVLIRRFKGARQILDDGAMRYECLGGANVDFTFGGVRCAGPGCGGETRAVSCAGASRLVLCEPWWTDSLDEQATTLLHECFHMYFGHIRDQGSPNLANAHCYDHFVTDFNGIPVQAGFEDACP
jgi:hypothetical protein